MCKHPTVKTITFDNDQAFSQHKKIAEAFCAKTYFISPYTSKDKGAIENRNGVITLFYPKKTDFNLTTKKDIGRVEREIHNKLVRKFGYLSPNEVFSLNHPLALIDKHSKFNIIKIVSDVEKTQHSIIL